MFCEFCGEQISDNTINCPKCGNLSTKKQETQQIPQTIYQQPANQQNPYVHPHIQPPPVVIQQNTYTPQQEMAPVVSIGEYMGMMILPSLLSLVTCGIGGFILLLVWAFGGNVNPNKQNFSKATLIFMLIVNIIAVLPLILFLFVFGGLSYLENIQYYLAFTLF